MIVGQHVEARTAKPAGDGQCWSWAALVTALVVLGFATALMGWVVIFAWLGHATWRAYQELVE